MGTGGAISGDESLGLQVQVLWVDSPWMELTGGGGGSGEVTRTWRINAMVVGEGGEVCCGWHGVLFPGVW